MTIAPPWQQNLRLLATHPDVRARIVCVPPAGGGASFFHPWTADVPPGVELWAVQLPGREDRLGEPPVTDLLVAARRVAAALQWLVDRPCVLFGHSMGALVGYEAARILAAQRTPGICHLFVSGCVPPDRRRPNGETFSSEHDVIAELRRIGFDSGALDDPETRAVIIPAIHNDLRMFYSYEYCPGQELTCPITVLVGREDPHVPAAESPGWGRHTEASVQTGTLPGDHYYLLDARTEILAKITGALSRSSG
ncbi:surfactin synthase thioesterase subunit [Kibdelosporangium banguiense]|uniref:Surfactin synthase thioesterase subunit n=1 Tax=Kibdelosporangium banguiense TaxID=1365924 RepID=A0ABS4TS42_9PSEU|nr:alpha/beta fold hydrolase [Kibdelosporangium banguiense]MBP2326814.1 surfactin synthase thioesterase subunit [Kibdelosporangium banguiense]